MYHEMTRGERRRRRRLVLVLTAAVAAIALAVALAVGAARHNAVAQGAQSVREAVLRAAAQCCAVEGSYPSTIEYLEEHYGLVVNRDDYAVTYEAFAANVAPSVSVVPR